MADNSKFKRLFIDIETSPAVVLTWGAGYGINISHENIIEERAIIMIAYKWDHEKTIHCLTWDKNHSDEQMLRKFIPILDSADQITGHNSNHFDLPWLRGRCMYWRIPCSHEYKSLDTCTESRKRFYLQSNKLDYLSQYLLNKQKIRTDFQLWKDVRNNVPGSLNQMIAYCKKDVALLEEVFHVMEPIYQAQYQ
jgi:DNA polymerase elongation subunit (family B)